MKIFTDYPQAIRFAYALQAHPGQVGASHSSMVKLALNEAGAKVSGVILDGPTLDMIGDFAPKLRDAIALGLPRYDTQTLIARYSHDWFAKRAAVQILQPYYRPALAPYANDARLIERMVTRHYLASRERGAGWGVDDISRDFSCAVERVANLGAAIETIACGMEQEALSMLEHRINLPTLEAVDA